jgi:hypothetical protein
MTLDAHPVPALACALTQVIALHNCFVPVLEHPVLTIAEAKSRFSTIWPEIFLSPQASTGGGCRIALSNTITPN